VTAPLQSVNSTGIFSCPLPPLYDLKGAYSRNVMCGRDVCSQIRERERKREREREREKASKRAGERGGQLGVGAADVCLSLSLSLSLSLRGIVVGGL